MQIKKIIPGLVLGLVFIGAFAFGINSISGNSSGSKTVLTQPTPSGTTGSVFVNEPAQITLETPVVVTTPPPVEVVNPVVEVAPVVENTGNTVKAVESEKNHKEKDSSGEKDDEGDD